MSRLRRKKPLPCGRGLGLAEVAAKISATPKKLGSIKLAILSGKHVGEILAHNVPVDVSIFAKVFRFRLTVAERSGNTSDVFNCKHLCFSLLLSLKIVCRSDCQSAVIKIVQRFSTIGAIINVFLVETPPAVRAIVHCQFSPARIASYVHAYRQSVVYSLLLHIPSSKRPPWCNHGGDSIPARRFYSVLACFSPCL